MKWSVAILLCCSVAFGQNAPKPAVLLPKVLASVVPDLKAKSHVAVLLPSELPQPFSDAKYATVQSASEHEYAISLYYELGVGDSGFAAFFAANARPDHGPKDIGNVREVKLSHGLVGYFREVSCGGSCAPAILWWEEDQVLYQVQLKLSPDLSDKDQESKMIAAANSSILAGPR